MKVAIVGAGLAGLSCAHELERLGIVPDLYEQNSFIGEAFTHSTAMLQVVDRPPGKNYMKYIKEKLYLDIKPLFPIQKLMHHSPKRDLLVQNNHFGFFLLRSNTKDSVKNQISMSLRKTRIFLNTQADIHTLKKKYDYVVVASGHMGFSREMGLWQTWFSAYVRAAVVLGHFDTSRVDMWINHHYCKNGYAYLTPLSDKKASVILVVSDTNEKDLNEYWNAFVYYENIKYPIIEEFTLHHVSGHVYPKLHENLIFTGLAGGSIDPFLGFGQLNSLRMGVYAARTIANGTDYHKQCMDVIEKNQHLYQLRKSFNVLKNKDYDKLLAILGLPGVRTILYKTPFNLFPVSSGILKKMHKQSGK